MRNLILAFVFRLCTDSPFRVIWFICNIHCQSFWRMDWDVARIRLTLSERTQLATSFISSDNTVYIWFANVYAITYGTLNKESYFPIPREVTFLEEIRRYFITVDFKVSLFWIQMDAVQSGCLFLVVRKSAGSWICAFAVRSENF